jgi:hypothetical protein
VRRIIGGGNVWVSELVLTYDGQPFYVVSVMEVEPGPSRAQWVEQMGSEV